MATAHRPEGSNRRVALLAALGALAMLGLGYASVPLYRLFCQATGFNGTTQRATAAQAAALHATGRPITIRFDANVAPGMKWQFRPEQVTQVLDRAVDRALTEPAGPVYLSLPREVLAAPAAGPAPGARTALRRRPVARDATRRILPPTAAARSRTVTCRPRRARSRASAAKWRGST